MENSEHFSQAHENFVQSPAASSGEFQHERNLSKPRKHVTSACLHCRQGKIKCDGNTPCARCVARSLACVYRSDDGRVRHHMKRKLEQLEEDSSLLHDLVETFKDAEDVQVTQIVSLIRSNASLREIHHFLTQMTDEARSKRRQVSPEIDEMRARTGTAITQSQELNNGIIRREHPRPRTADILSIHRLIDQPTHEVPAAPWTNVTDDKHLVSHLISLWASWDHPWPDGVVLKCFLRDMKQGQLKSLFCSPFLVNCILAAACPYSDYEGVKTYQGKHSELMTMFVKEAKSHLEQEVAGSVTPKVTTVQGLIILYLVVCKMNQDGQGYLYALQATSMCAELLRSRVKILKLARTPQEERILSYVLDYACWGVFTITTNSLICWKRPQRLVPPNRPFPDPTDIYSQVCEPNWVPYLQEGQEQDLQLEEVMKHFNTLAVMERDLTNILFADDADAPSMSMRSSYRLLSDFEVRVQHFYENLPQSIRQNPPVSISVFQLLFWCHVVWLTVLITQAENVSSNKFDSESLDASDNTPLLSHEAVTTRLIESALRVADLARLYRSQYGYNRSCVYVTHVLYQAVNVLIHNNKDGQHDADITEICTFLRAVARRFPFSSTVLRMIRADIKRQKLKLPPAAEKLFDDFYEEHVYIWREEEATETLYPYTSAAPLDRSNHIEGVTAPQMSMGEFLQTFENLGV